MYDRKNANSIREMFDAIAKNYQRTNAVLSFGRVSSWRRRLVGQLSGENLKILDLCTGTGDLGKVIQDQHPGSSLVGYDFSARMLSIAKRSDGNFLALIQGDVHYLPFLSGFDAVTLAFSLRNFDNLPAFFHEVYRVLRPGGGFYFLELTKPENRLLKVLYSIHLSVVLPWLGGLVSGNVNAYRYLAKSIKNFYEEEELRVMIRDAGFKEIRFVPILGGICSMIFANRPNPNIS